MFRSLRARLVLVMVLLILIMLTVVGTFLVNRVAAYYVDAFAGQMEEAFARRPGFVNALRECASSDDPPTALKEVLFSYSGLLGIDGLQRDFYVLDAETGGYLAGSDDEKGQNLEMTPSILAVQADTTKSAPVSARVDESFMDFAAPIEGSRGIYIIYIKDTKDSSAELISQLLSIVFDTLISGVALAIILALFLSAAISRPLERLTHGARRMASGTFGEGLSVESNDEIGVLTQSFNNMAGELKQTLEEIGSERDKLGTLFLHMTDGVASFDRDGLPIQANPAAERLLGAHLSEMGSYDKILGQIAPLSEVFSLSEEPRFLQKECEMGKRRLLISLAPFGRETTEGVMAVLHDVTEQHNLEESRREFVANISHELRTPLTNIHSYAETLLDSDNLPPETIGNFTRVILNEAERMNRIVRDLLNLSRFDYGKIDWHVLAFPLDEMLRDVCAAMRLEAVRKGHTLDLSCESQLQINGDRERIEQVVVNVLSNAINYTPAGGRIEVCATRAGPMFRITVTDNGIGIPKEDQPRVFERFYRVDKARSRISGGTGLGLSIAREIVLLHGGSIEIESASGEGTSVVISLPAGETS